MDELLTSPGGAHAPIEVKQVKEIILVSDDVHASRRLYREVLGLAMPARRTG